MLAVSFSGHAAAGDLRDSAGNDAAVRPPAAAPLLPFSFQRWPAHNSVALAHSALQLALGSRATLVRVSCTTRARGLRRAALSSQRSRAAGRRPCERGRPVVEARQRDWWHQGRGARDFDAHEQAWQADAPRRAGLRLLAGSDACKPAPLRRPHCARLPHHRAHCLSPGPAPRLLKA